MELDHYIYTTLVLEFSRFFPAPLLLHCFQAFVKSTPLRVHYLYFLLASQYPPAHPALGAIGGSTFRTYLLQIHPVCGVVWSKVGAESSAYYDSYFVSLYVVLCSVCLRTLRHSQEEHLVAPTIVGRDINDAVATNSPKTSMALSYRLPPTALHITSLSKREVPSILPHRWTDVRRHNRATNLEEVCHLWHACSMM